MAKDQVSRGVDAERLLNDPAFIAAFETQEKAIIEALATITLDGSQYTNGLVVEKVRDLQTLRRTKSVLTRTRDYGKQEEKRQEVPRRKRASDPRWD